MQIIVKPYRTERENAKRVKTAKKPLQLHSLAQGNAAGVAAL
jgi:hypothetical protein